MEWNEETLARLRELWTEGHSTAEIGRQLGVSKNAIVGKAHRLDLPSRPSPIRREQPAAAVLPEPAGTLPPLESESAAKELAAVSPAAAALAIPQAPSIRAPAPTAAAPRPEPSGPPPQPAAVIPLTRAAPSQPRPYARIITCCWPIGEPGTHSFHFCDAPSEPGRPYCTDHTKLAYVKVKDRREDAA